ncbi:hypothetical protein [Herbaspirillum huttiense]|uniref:hypothetical protein n=1 Tax=Herbaspirillum huttiense TaxID=863372 RepID=UPI003F3C9F5B
MNTIQETKGRLRGLSLALATILDNYGVNSNQQTEYNVARQELEDIIANMADAPPPAPVTVESVVAGIGDLISDMKAQIEGSNNADLAALGVKIDALVSASGGEKEALADLGGKVAELIGLANAHGETQQAAPAA